MVMIFVHERKAGHEKRNKTLDVFIFISPAS